PWAGWRRSCCGARPKPCSRRGDVARRPGYTGLACLLPPSEDLPMPRSLPCALLLAVLLPSLVAADEPIPPKGFTALVNGKDLAGWHGMPHFNPYRLAAMEEESRKKQIDKWTEDAKKHWTAEKGELVNDGKGAYLTTDREFGDIELLIEYRTVPKADS